jgi:hypothetical protein
MYRLKSTDSYATLAIIIKGVYLFVRHITTSISFLFILIKSTCIIEGDNNIVKDEENEGGGCKNPICMLKHAAAEHRPMTTTRRNMKEKEEMQSTKYRDIHTLGTIYRLTSSLLEVKI